VIRILQPLFFILFVLALVGCSQTKFDVNNQFAYVVSFYDSTLSVFKKGNKGKFHFIP